MVAQCPRGARFSPLRLDPCSSLICHSAGCSRHPSPEGAPLCASCWFPFIHHQGPEALTWAAGVLPAGPLRPGSLGSSTLNKRTLAGDQLQLSKLPLVLYFLFTILGCVGLTICLLELLSNKRKDGCGDGRQSYTSL